MSRCAPPPSTEERELYYFGLPSLPKLVARSSTHDWVNPQKPEFTMFTGTLNMYPKSLRPVGRHPLLHQLWNDASSSLRVQILELVSATADWSAIDILRIGLNDEFHITLLISVKPDSMSWGRGHSLVLRCLAILVNHGIHDVQCEIRESVVTFCAETSKIDSNPSTPNTFQLSSRPITAKSYFAEMQADISDCLGTKIAMKHLDSKAGTKGLYLSLPPSSPGGEPRIMALTCRHTVLDFETEGLKTYRRQQSGPFKEVIQVDQPTYESWVKKVEKGARRFRNTANKHSKKGYETSAAAYGELADSAMVLEQAMKPFEAASSRVIGQLLYSPEFTCASEHGAKWLRDWALIELLPGSHEAPLGSIKNKVYVGKETDYMSLVIKSTEGWKEPQRPMSPLIIDDTVELQKATVPMEELFDPNYIADRPDAQPLYVAKYGARGELTLGLSNTLKSVVRHTETPDGGIISEEWAVISANGADDRQLAFSMEGDSGSCIWDMEQRPAGIIMAGSGRDNVYDVTYAQPLERLLADIRSCGFDVSLV